jgi:hypothetical protein
MSRVQRGTSARRDFGKWKTTVVKPDLNAEGVVSGLERRGTTDSREVAALIRERYG